MSIRLSLASGLLGWAFLGHDVNYAALVVLVVLLFVWGVRARRGRQAAESATDAARAQTEQFVRAVPTPIIRVETDVPLPLARITLANAAACRALGYVEAELLDRPYMEIVTLETKAATRAIAEATDAGGTYAGHVNAWIAGPHHPRPGSSVWLRWEAGGDFGLPGEGYSWFNVITPEVEAKLMATVQAQHTAKTQEDLVDAVGRLSRVAGEMAARPLRQAAVGAAAGAPEVPRGE